MRLLIVDDELEFAQALAKGLRYEGYAVDIAPDGEQGWYLAEVNEYEVLILDLNLPGLDGLEVCHRLRASRPSLLILMLTARGQLEERVRGLELGADDYMVKPFHFVELLAHIRALLRRDMRARAPVLQYADLKLDPAAHIVWRGKQKLALKSKEFSLLEYLMYHQGEVVTHEDLLEHVWDMQVNPLTSTVRVHIKSLRRKLGDVAEAPRYIETIIGQGYRLGLPGNQEAGS